MEGSFFASKYFVISAVAAAIVVGGAAGAYYMTDIGRAFGSQDACDMPALDGTALSVTPGRLIEEDGRRRVESYAVNASGYVGGALDLCVDVGEILVEPSETGQATLEIVTHGEVAGAVEGTLVEARFRTEGDRLLVYVWQATRGEADVWFDQDSASVRVVLRVPASGAYATHATNDVGDVRISNLILEEARVSTDVGTVLVRGVDLLGNATLAADVGDAILDATSVTSGKITVSADVGNAEANLPQRADVGYDALARTDVGDAYIQIGDVEEHASVGDGPGEHETARSSGYASKPTKVVVQVTSDVGDARVVAT